MRFYIATRLERAAEHRIVRDVLIAAGHEITYDWTTHGSVQCDGIARIRDVAVAETHGVLLANIVIVLLPGGRGTRVELGLAIAAGKDVLLHTTDAGLLDGRSGRTCAFYHHPLVRHVAGALEDAGSWLALGDVRP